MTKIKYQPKDYCYALEQAANALIHSEYEGVDDEENQRQMEANKQAAKAIRKMADNYWKRNGHKQVKPDET